MRGVVCHGQKHVSSKRDITQIDDDYTFFEKLPAPHKAAGHRTCTGQILKAPVLPRVQHVLPKYCTIAIEFPNLTV